MLDFKSRAGRDLPATAPFTGTSAKELGSQGGKPCLSAPISSIRGAVGSNGSGQEAPAASASGRGEPGLSTEVFASARRANYSVAGIEGPDPFPPGIRTESLETEGKPEGAGDLITIPFMGAGDFITTLFVGAGDFFTIHFVGTIFFFPTRASAGGKGAERSSPGALRKVPSCLLFSRSLKRALRAWASAFRTSM